ncbi:glycosyltransferase family 2 protein [Candidatus Woesearchaeota archaeon]|nr:glycosyltransferase family 2 protein [Candidatus Woesearchaeota archaeon]MBT5273096.1 glycosyltransferase family 2 protein [Candidatus Woesearchaeota archaeon]MBT6041759.1 glycosyltransferase family 2 protein [Candidatus Woesearchaeota archaeon]MBT6337589.1 glycosyltransferase family 2 protein [Candidatus Woesearchaeota archaeon]MBT7927010.1 glycosyltransferase family 2 protein [Candidatus Woesearchaeota archaeon]
MEINKIENIKTNDNETIPYKSLSIIIPTYNEEENIERCLRDIPKMAWEVEILVMDDGKDKTTEIAEKIGKELGNVFVHHSSEKRGKGGAFLLGLEKAKGDVVIIMDGDLTVGGQELARLVKPIFNGEVDFVNGTRFFYPMEKGAMTTTNKIGNKIFAFMTSIVLRTWFTDVFCGSKAFVRKKLAGKLSEKEWPDLELLFEASKAKLRIKEVPVPYRRRMGGDSKVNALGTGNVLLKSFFRNLLKR